MGANTLIGGDRQGVGAVAFLGGRLYATLAGGSCSHGHPSEPNAVLRVFGNGTTAAIADRSNYLRTVPDSKQPTDGDYEPDGVWFNLVRAFGALYAVEPNRGAFYLGTLGRIDSGFAGAVYRVSADGRRVREVASGVRGVLGAQGGGPAWTPLTVDGLQACPCQDGHAVAVSPCDSRRVLFTTNDGGLWKSTDLGDTFRRTDVSVAGGPFLPSVGR